MAKHPTINVPDIGLMDHAWDLLGEWQAEFELPDAESPVKGKVTFRSWTDAELQLDPVEAAIAGVPAIVPLERASGAGASAQRVPRLVRHAVSLGAHADRWTHRPS